MNRIERIKNLSGRRFLRDDIILKNNIETNIKINKTCNKKNISYNINYITIIYIFILIVMGYENLLKKIE